MDFGLEEEALIDRATTFVDVVACPYAKPSTEGCSRFSSVMLYILLTVKK